ncbi:MAG: hypothetical protein AAGI71_10295 [Bacteroidota bacterium]
MPTFLSRTWSVIGLTLVISLLSPARLMAQQAPCNAETLRQANELYLNAENEAVMARLEDCILRTEGGFAGQELEQAYALYGQAALNLKLEQDAREAIRLLLQRVPNYQTDPLFDPPEYRALVDAVREELNAQRPPVVVRSFTDQTLALDAEPYTLDLNLYFADPNEDALRFQVEATQSGVVQVAVVGTERTFRLEITPQAPGRTEVTVRAVDPGGLNVAATFTVTVAGPTEAANAAPEPTRLIGGQTLVLDDERERTFVLDDLDRYFRDPNGDPLAYTAMTSDAAVAQVVVVPGAQARLEVTARSVGLASITVLADDGQGLQAEQVFRITVRQGAVATSSTGGGRRWLFVGGGAAVAGILAAVLLRGGGGSSTDPAGIPLPPTRPSGN